MKFENKVVIVTGGGQGIGRVISRTFANEGAKVVIADIDAEAGIENESYIKAHTGTALFVETDVSDESSVKNLIDKTVERFGTIDILINNAAISSFGNMFENDVSRWDAVIAVNLRGPYLCSKYAGAVMTSKNSGCIINMASTRAFMSEPNTEAYSASKGGIIALTHSLAVSLGKHKIRVNSISPGWIDVTAHKKKQRSRSSCINGRRPSSASCRPGWNP